jgi:hypothetical protein
VHLLSSDCCCLCNHVAVGLPPIWILAQVFQNGQLVAFPAPYCLLSSLVKFGHVARVVLCVSEDVWEVCFIKYTNSAHFDITYYYYYYYYYYYVPT